MVITGASAGVGRATAERLARDGASIGLIARGRDRLDAARAEVEQLGGRAHAVSADVADPAQVEAAAAEIEEALGPIDVWVNNAMATVFAPVARHDAGGVPPRDRGDLPRLGLGDDGRASPDAAARPRGDRPGRLGARLPRHPAPGRVLRLEARAPGLPRVAARRAAPRGLERPGDDGAAAGAEHAAVHLEPREDAAASRSRCRRSSSRRSRPRRSSGRSSHPQRQLMVGWPTVKAIVGNAVAPGLRRPLPRARRASTHSRPTSRSTPTAPTTSSSPCPATQGGARAVRRARPRRIQRPALAAHTS